MKKHFVLSILNVLALCVVIAVVSLFFIHDNRWIGEVLIVLGLVCLPTFWAFGIKIRSALPDICYGIIDDGLLAVIAIFGGHFGGIAGAIIGGVVGNALTDGIAGIFEGYIAEKSDTQDVSTHRSMLKSAVGKMAGCLLGAGVVLSVASFFP